MSPTAGAVGYILSPLRGWASAALLAVSGQVSTPETSRSDERDVAPSDVSRLPPHPSPLPRGGEGSRGDVRFSAVDVFVDAGEAALAAYQFELKVSAGDVTLVGVEGGEHLAFAQPPYYDPKALADRRIVIAAFDAGSDLPRGRTRVARLMVRVRGSVTPEYDATLVVAASAEAKPIRANISVVPSPGGDEAAGSEGAER